MTIRRFKIITVLTLGSLSFFAIHSAMADPAPDANSVLILEDTDVFGSYSTEAAAQGFTVVLVSDAEWATYSESDFASFRAIIIGDPNCVGGTAYLAPVNGNKADWSAAIGGGASTNPKLIIGTDENFHRTQGGSQLISSGIQFVTSTPGQTGLYFSFGCAYHGATPNTPVPELDELGAFGAGEADGCFDDAHIVATHPALAGTTDDSLSNWSCSVHNVFNSAPDSFVPLAIANGQSGEGSEEFRDGSMGIPYIYASGAGVSAVGEEVPVPTLSWWMMMLLVASLGSYGLYRLRRN